MGQPTTPPIPPSKMMPTRLGPICQSIIDFFQPLCNLLLFENDNEMLGLSVMSALISSLSIIPYAREALIKMINQNLQMKGPNELKKSNPFNNQENINIAIEGLLILIQEKPSLNKSDCRYMIDDVGLEALIHVSNLIVALVLPPTSGSQLLDSSFQVPTSGFQLPASNFKLKGPF